LNSHQPKGCFLSDRQKSPEFYPIKNVKKKKPIAVLKKKKKSDSASQHRRPQKGQKVDFDFCQFFFDFCVRLLDAVRKFERLTVQK
jgi:hypothetical protein